MRYDPMAWQRDANCASASYEYFFEKQNTQRYKDFCDNCPVVNECGEFAVIYNLQGVWGGLTDKRRKRRYKKDRVAWLIEDIKESGMYIEELRT